MLRLLRWSGSGLGYLDGFRPSGVGDAPFSAIDLRPDARVVDGYALVWCEHTTRGEALAADPSDTIPRSVVVRLGNALGLTLNALTGVALVRSLLVTPERGRILYPSLRGVLEVWIGNRLWLHELVDVPPLPDLIDPSDSGAGADESPLAGNWTTGTSDGNMQRLTNYFTAAIDGVESSVYWNANTPSNDQYSQIRAAALGTNSGFAVWARKSTSAKTGYIVTPFTGTTGIIGKHVAGSFTNLKAGGLSAATNDDIRIECEGTTIRARNITTATTDSTTDASIASGRWGMAATNTNSHLTEWVGADIGAVASPVVKMMLQYHGG